MMIGNLCIKLPCKETDVLMGGDVARFYTLIEELLKICTQCIPRFLI